MGLIRFARAIRGLSLAVWFGGGVMTFIAAYFIFRVAGDPANQTLANGIPKHILYRLAGDMTAPMLHFGAILKLVLAALALLTHGVLRGDPTSGRTGRTHRVGFLTLALATVIVCVILMQLEPAMLNLRQQFINDPNESNPARLEFAKLHGISMGLSLLEVIFVGITLVCVVI